MSRTHPIVDSLKPNPDQESAVISRGSDIVVTAGAGTGKTLALVGRYLSLLSDGLSPRQIAAITFTRKAAREMRNRVRRAIDSYLRQGDNQLRDHAMWREHFLALDAARIGTIHSLCSELLRAHPAEAAVDPRFSTLEEADAALLQIDVIDEALSWAATADGGEDLFLLFGERGLREILRTFLGQRLTTRAILHQLPAELLAHWQVVLRTRQDETLDVALRDPTLHRAIEDLRLYVPLDEEDRMAQQRQIALAAYDACRRAGNWPDRRQALQALDGINLQGGRQGSWPGGKEQLQDVKASLRALRGWWREQATLQNLELNENDHRLARAVPSLASLFDQAEASYTQGVRQRRALDFDDLEGKALQLLRENEAVCARWRGELRAILIDEYQDTNSRQRDLINLLNGDESKLFIVGDAKQSIYRFRGAEIKVFRQERGRIAQSGRAIDLRRSYRAHHQLVAALNLLLRPVLGEAEDPLRPWQEPFVPFVAVRQQPVPGLAAPWCELHLSTGSKSDGALDHAANALVARLWDMVQKPQSTLQFSDVAILCQASTSFAAYEDALDRAGMPYVTIAGRGFFERSEIRDVLNALQAIADPHDDLALVGLLRSPVIGLSDSDIMALVDAYRSAEAPSLWRWLLDASQETRIPDAILVDPRHLVRRLHARAGRLTVANVLKEFLDETGYRAALRMAGEIRSVRNLDKLLEVAHSTAFVSTPDFLEYMSTMRRGLSREGEARISGENAVQIMSIHQAKGLEFPIVVIGDVSYQAPTTPRHLLDEALGFVAKIRGESEEDAAVYSLALEREKSQQDAESARLLYVAATRARDKLLLNGVAAIDSSGALSKQRGWLGMLDSVLGLRGSSLDFGEGEVHPLELPLDVPTTISCTMYGPNYQPPAAASDSDAERAPELAPGAIALLQPLPFAPTDEATPDSTDELHIFAQHSAREKSGHVLGTIVHDALHAWKIPTSERDDRFRQWLNAYALRTVAYSELPLPQILDQATRLLIRFSEHDFFETLSQARVRLHEVPFSYQRDGHLHEGRIDVLFRDDEGWHVVDFKTDAIDTPAALHQALTRRYRPQLSRYAQAVQRLMGVQPSCHLCLLNFQGRVHVEMVNLGSR